MAKWIKKGKSKNEIQEDDKKVRLTVEKILSEVAKNGDKAVRDLSIKLSSELTWATRLIAQIDYKKFHDLDSCQYSDNGCR